ncbi:MAG: hypothetical protein MUP44_04775 [Anaerolineales bacterium]|nr:hypothetical protein [Anaerolineales bacterium]
MNHKSQSIILWVLGAGFVLNLFVCYLVGKFTGQISALNWFVPISLGLLVSLLASYVVYNGKGKRELTTTFAVVVFVLATLAAFILTASCGGFAF